MRKRRAADRDCAVPRNTCTRRSPTMNVITNLLAGVVHFLGWLV
ncbi:hypothetical protein [Streptomyces sp. NRRL F-5727]|nr:hypothetical protein [Streptomyces sp. NRRL F-5727]